MAFQRTVQQSFTLAGGSFGPAARVAGSLRVSDHQKPPQPAWNYCTGPESPQLYQVKQNVPRIRGYPVISDPRLNKGMGFSLEERQILGIHGLLPPAFMTQEQQAYRVVKNLNKLPDDLARYSFLNALQDRNERLFYRVLIDNVNQLMPVVYTPTVGLACQKFGFIYRRPKGLYITIHDNSVDKIYNILRNWHHGNIKAIVVTDGERILGLGDLGAYGMGIPVGKLSLYVALAGIQPQWCLPVHLDVGTNNEELLNDDFYIGLKHPRVRGDQYDEFVDNFMKAVIRRFGIDTLIQFEDFGNQNAFRLLERYQNDYCTFNDDIQGTASVAVAGFLGAIRGIDFRICNQKIADQKILFYGAGEASIGIAQLTCMAMMKESGMTWDEAKSRIWMIDSKGLLTKTRTGLSSHKQQFAQDFKDMKNLEDIVHELKPTVLAGAATIGGAFTERIIRDMASFNERPIIFALSNPTSKAECTAEQAYNFTDGKAVFASGSPFDPVTVGGKTFYPGQGNNSYIFPGVALGTIVCGVRHVSDEMFLMASETLANLVTQAHLDEGRVYPPLEDCREISVKIATQVSKHCYEKGLAAHYPEPANIEEYIRAQVYDPKYEMFTPELYEWPEDYQKSTFKHK